MGTGKNKVTTAGGGQGTRAQYALCGLDLTLQGADNLWPLGQTWSTTVKWPHKNKPATDNLAAWEITWTSTVGKYSGKYFPSPPQLQPLQLWYMVPKNVSTPNRRERHRSRKQWNEDGKEDTANGGSSHGGSEGSPGQQKLHCVPVSPSTSC